MAAKDKYLTDLMERLDLMNQVVKLSNLTGDDHYILQECHQRLKSVEKLQSEMHRLISAHEENKREMSGTPKQLEQLLSLADYVKGAVAKSVDEATLAKPRQPPPSSPGPRHIDAAAATTGIAYLTSEEFEHVPKYMKGRQTVETLNKCVDAFNRALATKYELFSRPKAQLRDNQWTKLNAFKSQETRETKGVKFVTESDLKAARGGPFETSKAVTNFVVVMRHCGRLREVRGQGFVRYAVI
ncbi:unnamed protein product [Ixodes hexagonus]